VSGMSPACYEEVTRKLAQDCSHIPVQGIRSTTTAQVRADLFFNSRLCIFLLSSTFARSFIHTSIRTCNSVSFLQFLCKLLCCICHSKYAFAPEVISVAFVATTSVVV